MRLLGTLGIALALFNAFFAGGALGGITVTVNRPEDHASGGIALTPREGDVSGGKAASPSDGDASGVLAASTSEGDVAGVESAGQPERDAEEDGSARVSDQGDTSQSISDSQSERDAPDKESGGPSEEGDAPGEKTVIQPEVDHSGSNTGSSSEGDTPGEMLAGQPQGNALGDVSAIPPQEGYASGRVSAGHSENDAKERVTVGNTERGASGDASASLSGKGYGPDETMGSISEEGGVSGGTTVVQQPDGEKFEESTVARQGGDAQEEGIFASASDTGGPVQEDVRTCTVHDMLPLPCESKSTEWSNDDDADPGYDCTCAAMKGRYFCPSQGSVGAAYSKWEPWAVSQGVCRSKTRADMAGAPLPSNVRLLFYGNSHLRQVVEGIMCMFQAELASKRVTIGVTYRSPGEGVEATVFGDMQCRECSAGENPEWVTPVAQDLLDHGCMSEAGSCRCDDNHGEYTFENGAVVQFQFSHDQKTKGLTDARSNHGMAQLSSYDAVFANPGNHPSIDTQSAIDMGLEVQAAGTQFFWLSAYDGNGRISEWSTDQRARFFRSGAKYVDVESMALGMEAWTKGGVEGGVEDEHFCMPGPPNEIGLLVLKIIWAMFEDESK